MKTAIIIADGIKQIMLTPESASEKMALKMITPEDNITLEVKSGTLYDGLNTPQCARGYTVQKSNGGYLRAYENEEALMLILTPKTKDTLTP